MPAPRTSLRYFLENRQRSGGGPTMSDLSELNRQTTSDFCDPELPEDLSPELSPTVSRLRFNRVEFRPIDMKQEVQTLRCLRGKPVVISQRGKVLEILIEHRMHDAVERILLKDNETKDIIICKDTKGSISERRDNAPIVPDVREKVTPISDDIEQKRCLGDVYVGPTTTTSLSMEKDQPSERRAKSVERDWQKVVSDVNTYRVLADQPSAGRVKPEERDWQKLDSDVNTHRVLADQPSERRARPDARDWQKVVSEDSDYKTHHGEVCTVSTTTTLSKGKDDNAQSKDRTSVGDDSRPSTQQKREKSHFGDERFARPDTRTQDMTFTAMNAVKVNPAHIKILDNDDFKGMLGKRYPDITTLWRKDCIIFRGTSTHDILKAKRDLLDSVSSIQKCNAEVKPRVVQLLQKKSAEFYAQTKIFEKFPGVFLHIESDTVWLYSRTEMDMLEAKEIVKGYTQERTIELAEEIKPVLGKDTIWRDFIRLLKARYNNNFNLYRSGDDSMITIISPTNIFDDLLRDVQEFIREHTEDSASDSSGYASRKRKLPEDGYNQDTTKIPRMMEYNREMIKKLRDAIIRIKNCHDALLDILTECGLDSEIDGGMDGGIDGGMEGGMESVRGNTTKKKKVPTATLR